MKKRIVICGSMSSYGQMLELQNELSSNNVSSIIPSNDDDKVLSLTQLQFEIYKRKISFRYLKKIRHPSTWAILIVNPKKYDIKNYIGPNTFAEIAIAFAQRKKIYLINDIPTVYHDELFAWRVISLNGNLSSMIQDYNDVCKNPQMNLF